MSTPSEATTEVRWLTPAELRAWRAYIEVANDLHRALESDLEPTGLDLGDYQVLVYLSESDRHRMRMCDLADALQLSPSGLTRRLDGLVKAGLVERVGSDEDRRVMLAVMTEAGQQRLRDAAPVHVDSVRRHLIDRLTPRQVEALGDIFSAVAAGLAED